jgi:hypothetical protein
MLCKIRYLLLYNACVPIAIPPATPNCFTPDMDSDLFLLEERLEERLDDLVKQLEPWKSAYKPQTAATTHSSRHSSSIFVSAALIQI